MFRKILVLEILFLLYVINNISASFIISIQTDNLYNEDNETRNVSGIDDMFVHNLIGHASTNELETLYASSSFGKSHRFYYTLGERQDGDKCIDQFAKTLQWKNETDAKLNIQYPRDGIKNDKKLTYVFVIVYQGSAVNRIHLAEGGLNQTFINFEVSANATKFLSYNATLYGL